MHFKTCLHLRDVHFLCETTLLRDTGSCTLTPELLTAGGAVGRLMGEQNPINGLRSLII